MNFPLAVDSSNPLWSPERRLRVTPLAVVERKSDFPVAGTAVSPFDIRKHREVNRIFLGGREYFGMAQFTAVPNGMLLVRENDRVDPLVSCHDGKILPVLHLRLSNR